MHFVLISDGKLIDSQYTMARHSAAYLSYLQG